MSSFIIRRLFSAVPVLFMVAVIVFSMLRLTPGDPAAIIGGDGATIQQLEEIRRNMGLDKPVFTQFVQWMGQLLRGNLGDSLISGTPVTNLIADRISPTIILAVLTVCFSVIVSLPLGILAAWRRGHFLDRIVMAGSVFGFSVPVFITGYILIYFLSMKLGLFPVQGYKPPSDGFWPFLQRMVLPTLSLSTVYIALISRIVRTSMIEVMNEDYIRTARAKGLSDRGVLLRHALKNAAVPIVTIIGVSIAMLIGGVVVTETVFNIPGLGRLVVDAILARDYPVVQALLLLFSFMYVLINLLIDLTYSLLDPRIRY